MDKNMINIDDLLKQRLAHGEEKERPGAWLQMRELLDKELPVTQAPTAAFNWRRMMGYLAGLALLATVSVGGYQVATRINADGNTDKAVSQAVNGNNGGASTKTIANTTTSSNNTSSSNNQTPNPQTSNTTATIANNTDNNKAKTANSVSNVQETKIAANNTPATSAHTNSNKATGNTNGIATVNNDNNGNNQKPVKNGQSAPTTNTGLTASSAVVNASGKSQLDVNSKSFNKQADNKLAIDNNTVALNNNTASNNVGTSKETPATQQQATQRNYGSGNNPGKSLPVKSNLQQPVANTAVPIVVKTNNTTGTPSATSTPAATGNSNSASTPSGSNTNIVASNTGNKPNPANRQGQEAQKTEEEKSYINKIETKEKYSRTTGWKKDTIATGKVEWPNEPMLAKANENKADNTVVPAASMSVKGSEEHLVPLADYKVSSKQAHYEKVNHFAEMVQNAKVRMGSVRFHPGLIIGANTSISSQNSLFGFQLGATGTLSLNDRWGILTELKYVQRLRKDGRMDAYLLDQVDSNINTAGQKIYTYDSTVRYFNYTTISSIELPVAIKYSLKRLNLFGGGNLVYNFGINADPNNNGTVSKEALSISSTINYINGRPQIEITDFQSRFSIGYLIGAGYQLSPAVQLDVRLTQNIWDNAKTDGAKLVSKDLYKMPSIQINMSYRFSNNKNRPMKAR